MERRSLTAWAGLVLSGILLVSCMVLSGSVAAEPGPGTVEQGFAPQSQFQNPEEFRQSQGNNPGDTNLPGGLNATSGKVSATAAKPSGIKAWFADHGKGLGLGLLEGVGIGLGVVALGALGVLAAPVVGIAAVGAVAGCAIYGAITGADRFSPWACAVNGIVGAVSAGLGATVAAGSKLLSTVVNMAGGGIAGAATYLASDPHPTVGGTLAAFGISAGTAGALNVVGQWLSKTQVYQKAANLLHIGTRATKAVSAVGQSLDDASTQSIDREGASLASEAVEATGKPHPGVSERLSGAANNPSGGEGTPTAMPVPSSAETANQTAAPVAGGITWPPNRGFHGTPTKQVLQPGTLIDRYGHPGGTFVSPKGIPFGARALPAEYETGKPYHVYEVVKPIEVDAGLVEPWFGQPGMGTQYELPAPAKDLIEKGVLREVKP